MNIGGQLTDALRSRGWKTALVRKISACAGKTFYKIDFIRFFDKDLFTE